MIFKRDRDVCHDCRKVFFTDLQKHFEHEVKAFCDKVKEIPKINLVLKHQNFFRDRTSSAIAKDLTGLLEQLQGELGNLFLQLRYNVK